MTDLVEAARFEVARRESDYPKLVLSAKKDAQEATVDYQAWCCILGWLADDRFQIIHAGGVNGDTIVGWPEAEASAARALAAYTQTAEAAAPDKAPALWQRRAAIAEIHRKVALRRQSIDQLNRHLRERAQQQHRAAA